MRWFAPIITGALVSIFSIGAAQACDLEALFGYSRHNPLASMTNEQRDQDASLPPMATSKGHNLIHPNALPKTPTEDSKSLDQSVDIDAEQRP